METQYRIRNILMTLFIIAKGEPDDYGQAESKEGDDLKSIDNRRLMKHIMEIYSVAKAILRTVFVSKVSPITMKTQSGDSVIMMMPATVRVSPMKLIMEIHSRMKMILTTLFVLKVSRMTM